MRKKHHSSIHVRLRTGGTNVCRCSHVRQGSSMWHYLMFCSINDSAIQLGSVAGIAPLSPPPSPTYACLSTGASPQKSNVRCYPSLLIEKDLGCIGARRPCFWAGDGKTPLLGLFCFGAWWLSWLHHDDHINNSLFILHLTEGCSSTSYHSEYSYRARFYFCMHLQEY